jgi:translation initiation factor 1
MPFMGLFDGTPLERPVTCAVCGKALADCRCPRDAAGRVCRPADQPARVSREKRGKGKVVTVVSGLDPAASDLPGLLARLKSACAAGGTISGDKLEVQGDHRDRVVVMLKELGYPAKTSGG